MNSKTAALAALGLFAFVACSSDQSSSPESTNQSSTIDQSTESAGTSGDSTGASHFRLGVPGPLASDVIPSGCDWDAALQRFVCAASTDDHGGTHTRSYAFLDANGVSQSAYDVSSTASMSLRHSFDATPTVNGNAGVIHHEDDFTATGLAGAETTRLWNGTMLEHSEGVPPHGPGGPGGPNGHGHGGPPDSTGAPPDSDHVPPDFSDLVFDSNTTIANVVMPEPLSSTSWPKSGTITTVTHIEGGPNGTEDRTVTLTFNGTQYASLFDGTNTIEVDLARGPGGHGPGGPGGPGGHGPRR
ncbi:MAG: hypothetical protein U0527_09060 [Candidatus Eisenbacteria bacterium]